MRKVRLPLGPAVIDVVGTALADEDRKRLCHPATGAVILFSRNYQAP
jgi:beta-N-acetylhexosaminidase